MEYQMRRWGEKREHHFMEANCQQVLRMVLPELPDDMGTLLRYIRVPRYCAWLLLLLFLFCCELLASLRRYCKKERQCSSWSIHSVQSAWGFCKNALRKASPSTSGNIWKKQNEKTNTFKYLHHKWLWRQLLDIKYFAYVGGLGLEMDFAFDGKHRKVTRWTSDADFHETTTKV